MIPFHKLFSLLFKSFLIGEETVLIDRLIKQGYKRVMVIKRSWIFVLYMIGIPLVLLILSGASIWIAYYNVEVPAIQSTIIIGNILMSAILLFSSITYVWHFRKIYSNSDKIITDLEKLKKNLEQGDKHFITFFNWSITNQCLLFGIMILEIILIFTHRAQLNSHLLVLSVDFLIIAGEIYYLQQYRKKMMDLEMDFNIIVQGKIFLVNQTGVLSETQTIESNKIKTIRANFPTKLASFFGFGNIEILTEGDAGSLGAIIMPYVTDPVSVVNSIQILLGEIRSVPPKVRQKIIEEEGGSNILSDADAFLMKEERMREKTRQHKETNEHEDSHIPQQDLTSLHTMDTRGRIRDILQ